MHDSVHKSLCTGLALVLGCGVPVVQAALPDGAILAFTPGVAMYDEYGNFTNVASGSYFAVDVDGNNKFTGMEKLPIEMYDGIILGISQPATPAAPAIDQPWTFFGIQGVHRTSSPVSDHGDGTLDFSGWGVHWNGIDIAVGDLNRTPVPDTLRATIICSSSPCQVGDSYMLDYVGHVPMGHPSGFGGVGFALHLEGTITDGVLPPRITISVAGGAVHECTSPEGADIMASANATVPAGDAVASIDWTLNGEPIGSGAQITQAVALGPNTLAVQLQTQAGLTASGSSSITVRDTQSPVVSAAFLDARTGEEVMHVGKNGHVSIQARATDACDPDPAVQALIGAPVSDGDQVTIQVERDRVSLPMPEMTLSVTARDAAGNAATETAGLVVGK